MAPVIASPPDEPRGGRWSSRLSLRQRILAVNIVALALLAGSVFYLDSYRARIIDERVARIMRETEIVATALAATPPPQRPQMLEALSRAPNTRFRMADGGRVVVDSWATGDRSWHIQDRDDEPWQRLFARWLDDAIDFAADAKRPERFAGFTPPAAWRVGSGWSVAADRTHIVWAGVLMSGGAMMMAEWNARDIRRLVRAERFRMGLVIAAVTLLSVLLSLFLARTIAEPLRVLSRAAIRVRHGRAREVNVPRLPDRNDEIGLLARSLSDMTHSLRQRMDAVEAFAADVAHELKNPLASLSSATQALRQAKDQAVVTQLQAIVDEDVIRLNRLITDISDLSRIDAQLARTRFEPVDLGRLIEAVLTERKTRNVDDSVKIAFARPRMGTAIVQGDARQLQRLVENLLANAVSFSPQEGVVSIAATRAGASVLVTIEDQGPGVPESAREAIFQRFHTDRGEAGQLDHHSGLGLSIARTIVEAHEGSIAAGAREGDRPGARFTIRLPALEDAPS